MIKLVDGKYVRVKRSDNYAEILIPKKDRTAKQVREDIQWEFPLTRPLKVKDNGNQFLIQVRFKKVEQIKQYITR